MCQGCVDDGALSQETYDKIGVFSKKWPSSNYGPAHIVIDDDNLEDGHLDWCMGLIRAVLAHRGGSQPDIKDMDEFGLEDDDFGFLLRMAWYEKDETDCLEATLAFLKELRAIPEEVR